MRYLSVCSGIEAATAAWSPLGFEAVAFSETDKFPAAVLAHHYPTVQNLGDMTLASQWSNYEPNILVGGTPCQSFSVAGLRKGLADPRGDLMLTYLAIADRYQPEWLVWENVPGVLSSGSGRDFGTFLGALGQLGYGWAYRVLDAQFFGVPQRRRRVFVVGHFGDWRRAAAVLFERHSLQRHPAPRREKREGVAAATGTRTFECGGIGSYSSSSSSPLLKSGADLGHGCEALVGSWWDGGQTAQTLDAVLQKGQTMPEKNRFPAVLVPDTAHALRGEGFDASEDGTGRGTPLVPIAFDCKASGQNGFGVGEIASTMRSMGHSNSHQNGGGHQAVAVALRGREGGGTAELSDVPSALRASGGGGDKAHVLNHMQVRRLTPRECELLQGFPSIRERVTVEACTDPQNNTVTVALSCLRWPSNASPVDAQRYPQNANIVENISSMYRADREPLAALSVRTSSADLLHEIRSHGKLMWSASSVAESNRYPPSTQAAGIAAALAPHLRDLALAIRTGKAESLQNIRLSTQARDGAKNATRFGNENAAFASGATNAASLGKFTTSTLGSLAPICISPVATSLCSVLAAISGCIPNETLPERFSLLLDLETPYTLIPFTHGKPAADGPRYKALGNSMAVPCMSWIGERIQLVDWLLGDES